MCQAAAHVQQVEHPAVRQILTGSAVESILGDNGRHINGHAGWSVRRSAVAALLGGASQSREGCVRIPLWAAYTASLNLNVEVFDFVKRGGPNLTVGSTTFELEMAL